MIRSNLLMVSALIVVLVLALLPGRSTTVWPAVSVGTPGACATADTAVVICRAIHQRRMWDFARRHGYLLCPRCNYDLHGQTDLIRYSECGTERTRDELRVKLGVVEIGQLTSIAVRRCELATRNGERIEGTESGTGSRARKPWTHLQSRLAALARQSGDNRCELSEAGNAAITAVVRRALRESKVWTRRR